MATNKTSSVVSIRRTMVISICTSEWETSTALSTLLDTLRVTQLGYPPPPPPLSMPLLCPALLTTVLLLLTSVLTVTWPTTVLSTVYSKHVATSSSWERVNR